MPVIIPVEKKEHMWYYHRHQRKRPAMKGNDAVLKRTIAAAIVLIMLVCMVTVSASDAGTSTDPLITRSYLERTYAETLKNEFSVKLGGALTAAMIRLDEIHLNQIGWSFAPGFIPVEIAEGLSLSLTTGSSFILISGTATINVIRGEVIDVSSGNAVATGTRLEQYKRYFCTEDTRARITANAATLGQVDGQYLLSSETPVAPLHPFIDIFETDWYYNAVLFVYTEGLYQGTSANTFSPKLPMTRGMFVTLLHKVDGLPETGSGGMFSDVTDASEYYYNAVTWANASGIVTGYPDGTFKPGDSITREQMAVTMYRYAGYKGHDMAVTGNEYDAFPDRVEVSDYAVDALRWAASKRVINGSDGMILPHNTATRAEVAQIVMNYIERIGW